MDRVYAIDRVEQSHLDVSMEDAARAWGHCIRGVPRPGKELEVYVGIGYDVAGRLLVAMAIRDESGDWVVRHAQTPPQERAKRELGFVRRGR